MRQFKIIFSWQDSDHIDKTIHGFSDGQEKEMLADEFLSMMQNCVSKTIPECDSVAKSYIERLILDEDYINDMGIGTIESVEEINA
jgi:hypothetical protein